MIESPRRETNWSVSVPSLGPPMSRDFRFWSVEILWTVQSPHSRELTLAVPKLPIYVETIVPREPVRTTLRFAASASLRLAPSVCVRAPTRGPMSLRGKHCFKSEVLQSRTTAVLCVAGSGLRMVRCLHSQIVGRRNVGKLMECLGRNGTK